MFRSLTSIRTAVLCFVPALTASAFAQGSFDNHVADMLILQDKTVQKDIGLTTAQRDKMNVASKAYDSSVIAYRSKLEKVKGKPDEKVVIGYQMTFRNKVLAQLSSSQLHRLGQLSLQHDGVAALADDTVAKRIGLSTQQLSKVRGYLVQSQKDLAALRDQVGAPIINKYKGLPHSKDNYEKAQKEMAAASKANSPKLISILKRAKDSIMGVMSSQQKQTWDGLLGKPYGH